MTTQTPGLSNHERRALDEIAAFKKPDRGLWTRLKETVSAPVDLVSDVAAVSSNRSRLAALIVVVLLVGLFAPSAARADGGDDAVAWRDGWSRFRDWQYVSTGILLFGGLSLRAFTSAENVWGGDGAIWFDEPLTEAVMVTDPGLRDAILVGTDVSFFGIMAYRAFDSIVVPGLIHDDWDLALQMAMIDVQSFGVVAGVIYPAQYLAGRQRPAVRHCGDPEKPAHMCDPYNDARNRSLIAGHPATALAGAGTTCLHHAHNPLYGGGWRDTLPCVITVASAALNGVGRVMTEQHWPTDLILGYGLGVVAGWVVPMALHYGWDHPFPPPASSDDETPSRPAAGALGAPPAPVHMVPLLDRRW